MKEISVFYPFPEVYGTFLTKDSKNILIHLIWTNVGQIVIREVVNELR